MTFAHDFHTNMLELQIVSPFVTLCVTLCVTLHTNMLELQIVSPFLINNLSTVTSTGKDASYVGNVQNYLAPLYLQTNASDYNPAFPQSAPGNIGIRDNSVVNSFNNSASVTSGASIPGGAYFNIPGGILPTRIDG
jgi:hypothetical protein